jgi:hypothetical protein
LRYCAGRWVGYSPDMILGLPILILVIVFIVLAARGTFSKKD